MSLTEAIVEEAALGWFQELGYAVLAGPQLAPGEPAAERDTFSTVVLEGRLRQAIRQLNPAIPDEAREEALRKLLRLATPSLVQTNRAFHRLLREGVPVEYPRPDGSIAGDHVRLVDFAAVAANDWLVVNQISVSDGQHNRRPALVVILNGLSLGLIELKNAAAEDATIWSAYAHLQTYKKDFLTTAYAFTSKDGYLNKAHAQHLEARLIGLAQAAKRCRLENVVQGRAVNLAEMDRAEAEGFLEEVLICFPVLGLRVFEQPPTFPSMNPSNLFFLRGPEAEGRGYESPNGFTVLKGAKGRRDFTASSPDALMRTREQLIRQGVLAKQDNQVELLQDYEFKSPSQAAGLLLARSANGRLDWKDDAGITLKEHQERAAAAASADTDP